MALEVGCTGDTVHFHSFTLSRLGGAGGTGERVGTVGSHFKTAGRIQELAQEHMVRQGLVAQPNGFMGFQNHQTGDLAIIVDSGQHPDVVGIAVNQSFHHKAVFRLVDRNDIGILTAVGLHHEGFAAGQQRLHQPKVFLLSFLCGSTLQRKGHAKENQSSHQNGNDDLFHLTAAPFPVPKRRMAV